ncbi:MAG: hypothetical protein JWM96_271 [Alphaproteobacteria bacterium]|nr:hypothetical protein [Alphaproteobacteria bacterium]
MIGIDTGKNELSLKLGASYEIVFDRVCENKDHYFTKEEVSGAAQVRKHYMIAGSRHHGFSVNFLDNGSCLFKAHPVEVEKALPCLEFIAGHEIGHAVRRRNYLSETDDRKEEEKKNISRPEGFLGKAVSGLKSDFALVKKSLSPLHAMETMFGLLDTNKEKNLMIRYNSFWRNEEYQCDAFALKAAPDTDIDVVQNYFISPHTASLPDRYYEMGKWDRIKKQYKENLLNILGPVHPDSQKRCDRLSILMENQKEWPVATGTSFAKIMAWSMMNFPE